jgi:WD40 repeat protein
MSTVLSNQSTAEVASRNDDARQESDTTPAIPINVISHWILRFVQDRLTWNAVCSANKELHEAGMRITPPWPETAKLMLGHRMGALKFSPCGSFLASGSIQSPWLVRICDRRGSLTPLTGHTSGIHHLSFSSDGNYLASAAGRSYDTSIRLWPTNSAKLPQQSEKKLRGHQRVVTCLNFSRDDSNLLASADSAAVKLWNVEQEVCIYNFNHRCGCIRSLCFLPARAKRHTCVFATLTGPLIRICWDDLSGITSHIVDMPGLGKVQTSTFSHCGSLLAAACPTGRTITLYDMRAMVVEQRVSTRHYSSAARIHVLAFSPDCKTLVFALDRREIQICKVDDLNSRRRLVGPEYTDTVTWAVAFHPSSQLLASAGDDQVVRLWTL